MCIVTIIIIISIMIMNMMMMIIIIINMAIISIYEPACSVACRHGAPGAAACREQKLLKR